VLKDIFLNLFLNVIFSLYIYNDMNSWYSRMTIKENEEVINVDISPNVKT
jgi:hypothetical protein